MRFCPHRFYSRSNRFYLYYMQTLGLELSVCLIMSSRLAVAERASRRFAKNKYLLYCIVFVIKILKILLSSNKIHQTCTLP